MSRRLDNERSGPRPVRFVVGDEGVFDELLDRCWDMGTVLKWGRCDGHLWLGFHGPSGHWEEVSATTLEEGARLIEDLVLDIDPDLVEFVLADVV